TYYRSNKVKKHGGSADITIPFGTPIVAIRDGEVISATRTITTLGGYLVKINHGHGYHSLYSHLLQPSHLKVGDKVKTGDLLGRVGRTGNANMTHLHFALYKDGVVVNIAGLDFGDWVQQGNFLGGSYP